MSKLRILAAIAAFHAAPTSAQDNQFSEEVFDLVDQIVSKKDLNNIPDYKDDRSTPEALVSSYYNALNRGEFSRAYSYFDRDGSDFAQWLRGYEYTRHVELQTGASEGDPGAGTLYWHQPVAIEAVSYDGIKEVFGGCYEISLGAPLNQEVPPFRPMAISSGSLHKSSSSLEDSLPKSCMPN